MAKRPATERRSSKSPSPDATPPADTALTVSTADQSEPAASAAIETGAPAGIVEPAPDADPESAAAPVGLTPEARAARRRNRDVGAELQALRAEFAALKTELAALSAKLAAEDTPANEKRELRARKFEVRERPRVIAARMAHLRDEKRSLRGATQPADA